MPRHELQNRDWAILTGNLGNQDDVHVRPFLRPLPGRAHRSLRSRAGGSSEPRDKPKCPPSPSQERSSRPGRLQKARAASLSLRCLRAEV